VILFCDLFLTLNDPTEQATASCKEEDYAIMGLWLIQDIVKRISTGLSTLVPAWSFREATHNAGDRTPLLLKGKGGRRDGASKIWKVHLVPGRRTKVQTL
jgi:hypothetical protein